MDRVISRGGNEFSALRDVYFYSLILIFEYLFIISSQMAYKQLRALSGLVNGKKNMIDIFQRLDLFKDKPAAVIKVRNFDFML